MSLRLATAADAVLLAAMHERAFEAPWGAAVIAALIDGPGGFCLIAGETQGFILCRAIGGEAEILTLAVEPAARRQGLGQALVEAAAQLAQARDAEFFFLEVAEDNAAALALYERTGFAPAGLRPGYYRRANGATDALVMRRRLNTAS